MQKVYLHPLPVRIWHWLNAAGFIGMILTGLQIRYVGVISILPFRLAVELHNWIGFGLIANFFLWLDFYVTSPRFASYRPELNPKRFIAGSLRQMQYYCYGMFRGEANPHRIEIYNKFNPMQAVLYQFVMFVALPVQAYTGVLLWDVERFRAQVNFFGGVRVIDSVHVLIFIFFVAYILIHPYLGTLGATRTGQYRGMITGYEEVEEGEGEAGPAAAAGTSARG
jgi:thiosulfate reductase cytochrome b subunit